MKRNLIRIDRVLHTNKDHLQTRRRERESTTELATEILSFTTSIAWCLLITFLESEKSRTTTDHDHIWRRRRRRQSWVTGRQRKSIDVDHDSIHRLSQSPRPFQDKIHSFFSAPTPAFHTGIIHNSLSISFVCHKCPLLLLTYPCQGSQVCLQQTVVLYYTLG